jgi:hypothetical protein
MQPFKPLYLYSVLLVNLLFMMSFSQKFGIVSCLLIIVSFFLNWGWYPDIQKYFTAFFSEGNHYGKPGIWLSVTGGSGILFYLINKPWTQRLNLIIAGLSMAYAIRTYLLYSSGYDGFVPDIQPGLYLMLAGSIGHIFGAGAALAVVKRGKVEV